MNWLIIITQRCRLQARPPPRFRRRVGEHFPAAQGPKQSLGPIAYLISRAEQNPGLDLHHLASVPSARVPPTAMALGGCS